ncbi:hypothetical protein RF11_13458 [Thelohanellus kitauei]|uniref:Uncharacterized protein n=1 Tax=Thelohanellus kitauei TaxID=669202 RepID=A0A0C2JCQ6_THEKT|nr:hypothetical protein RF11_13458 [Thelohanellus kitauei]
MTHICSMFIFGILESLIFMSLGPFIYVMIVPSLFSICAGPPNSQTCAFFGILNLYYKDEKFEYGDTTAIRALVLICAVLMVLSALAAILGYFAGFKVLGEGIIFLTITALTCLSIAYTIQWFQSKLYGSSFLDPFPYHELRPISQNLSFPCLLACLYPTILVFFLMGLLVTYVKIPR